MLFFTLQGLWSVKKVYNAKFGKLVDTQNRRLSSYQADNVKCQYNDILQSACVIHQEKFSSFDYKSDWVDTFLGQLIKQGKMFTELLTVCIFVFMLVHGQS